MTPLHIRRRTQRVLEVTGTLVCVWALSIFIVAKAMRRTGATNDE